MKSKYQEGDTITWLQVHNLLPLAGVVVSAVSVFFALSNRIDLSVQRLNYIETKADACSIRLSDLEKRANQGSFSSGQYNIQDYPQSAVKGVFTGPSIAPNQGQGGNTNPTPKP